MGYRIVKESLNEIFEKFSDKYVIYAPKVFEGDGTFSDVDVIRYGEVSTVDEIVFDKKSEYSFKEIISPITQTLFYFTEDEVTVPNLSLIHI